MKLLRNLYVCLCQAWGYDSAAGRDYPGPLVSGRDNPNGQNNSTSSDS